MAVSPRPEIIYDWSERVVFGRKIMLYDDRSSEGRRTFMGHLVYSGQPLDSRRQVMRKQPVLVCNKIANPYLMWPLKLNYYSLIRR